ncbi:indole-2-monooxygenase protein [Vigna angularis]|uniref:Indole-2-monooxygenase protein n=1 Tax=Phaseolus angularis TaxID=3914 RepID=A0A8T0JRS2_PHAAN|nr:indole-2-monooxygenase protein [Vigna angularis]
MIMAIASLDLILANLLRSFDWELPVGMKKEDIDTEVLPGITQHKKNPLSASGDNIVLNNDANSLFQNISFVV